MTSCNTLSNAIANRRNNLNLIKLMAALLVIVSHAYAFAIGYAKKDWFFVLTDGKGDLGGLAVSIFFFYSGLLISRSLLNNQDAKRYFKRRLVRIYPSFILVTLAIVFLAAPFVTTLAPKEYFTNSETYAYLKNLIFLTEHDLPGVFVGNVYGTSVNGSIWTIRVEMFCYLFCYLFSMFGLLNKKRIIPSVALYMLIAGIMGFGAISGISGMSSVIMPITMFYLGMVYTQHGDKINLNLVWTIFAGAGFIISCLFHQVIFASMVFLPYILCYLAFATKKVPTGLNRMGECSYEIYLWGAFVGQMMTYMYGGNMSVYLNMALTIPISLILGYITNQLVSELTTKKISPKS